MEPDWKTLAIKAYLVASRLSAYADHFATCTRPCDCGHWKNTELFFKLNNAFGPSVPIFDFPGSETFIDEAVL